MLQEAELEEIHSKEQQELAALEAAQRGPIEREEFSAWADQFAQWNEERLDIIDRMNNYQRLLERLRVLSKDPVFLHGEDQNINSALAFDAVQKQRQKEIQQLTGKPARLSPTSGSLGNNRAMLLLWRVGGDYTLSRSSKFQQKFLQSILPEEMADVPL